MYSFQISNHLYVLVKHIVLIRKLRFKENLWLFICINENQTLYKMRCFFICEYLCLMKDLGNAYLRFY